MNEQPVALYARVSSERQAVFIHPVHFTPSRFANKRIASSIIAVWLIPSFCDKGRIKCLASSDKRTLVGWFFIRYVVAHIYANIKHLKEGGAASSVA